MASITNRRLVDTEGADFYPTPEWGARALLAYERFAGTICEPCCGDGAMANVLAETGCEVIASDLHDRGFGSVADVFDIAEADNFITNPPFNIASDILDHALTITRHKVCLLLRTAFLESRDRHGRFFAKRPPSRVYVFSERLSMYPAGRLEKNGGTTSYSWFVWDNGGRGKATELLWIEPGMKARFSGRTLFDAQGQGA